jgi:Plavaka transposase
MPPPPRNSDQGPDDWTPYDNRLKFEVADFLYRRNQMSAGDINFVLNLWAASLAIHNDTPPFSTTADMHNTIDATPLGDVPWESFTLQYNGAEPAGDIPSWMKAEYDVWFRDPRTLVHNLLSNPDFKSDFDYAPFQEHAADGGHRFQDFMSGNWALSQAVSPRHDLSDSKLVFIVH